MLRFLFDTDHLTLFQHGLPALGNRLSSQPPGSVGVLIVTIEESPAGPGLSFPAACHGLGS
ncbi:MAG TPA: hypothetical protein VKA15_27230 [Isosphaeraceae bacterium]|nr:hypothetical protein [Isosphaeraceae bacterium]